MLFQERNEVATYEDASELAKELAETFIAQRLDIHAELPLIDVDNEYHVPIYKSMGSIEVWSVGLIFVSIGSPYCQRGYLLPAYVSTDGMLVFLWPTTVCIASAYRGSGWSDQHATVLMLRELDDRHLSSSQLEDLCNQLKNVLSQTAA